MPASEKSGGQHGVKQVIIGTVGMQEGIDLGAIDLQDVSSAKKCPAGSCLTYVDLAMIGYVMGIWWWRGHLVSMSVPLRVAKIFDPYE